MEEFIKGRLRQHDIPYESIPDTHLLNIYQLFHNNEYNEVEDGLVLLYYGIYSSFTHNYANMIQYLLRAIEYGNAQAGYILARYYERLDDHNNTIKYYSWAVEHNSINAMRDLASYYYNENNVTNAIKYASMAVARGCSDSLNNLGIYYTSVNDRDNAVKCYLGAIKSGNHEAMANLATHYYMIDDIDKAIHYVVMALDNKYYHRIWTTLGYCKAAGLIDHSIIILNKILNTEFNDKIIEMCESLLKVYHSHNLLNILINVNPNMCKTHHDTLSLLS